jgi:hypothetical protein
MGKLRYVYIYPHIFHSQPDVGTPKLTPSAVGFAGSAQNVTFSLEGGASVPIFRADLTNAGGQPTGSDVNLAERIQNQDGKLVFGTSRTESVRHVRDGPR